MRASRSWFCWFLVLQYATSTSAMLPIENTILGTPRLDCLEDSLEFAFSTQHEFIGRLYTKGRADDPECRQDFFVSSGNSSGQAAVANYNVKMGHCGMARMRSIDPPGMQMIITIVVSFHPIFETRFDRAYRLQCLFRPLPPMTVMQSLDVSNLPTTVIGSSVSIGACAYSVRHGSVEGPPMRFATVGDRVVHVWECEGPESMLSLLVHSCYASDNGAKMNVPIVDERGCSMDPLLLETVRYEGNDNPTSNRSALGVGSGGSTSRESNDGSGSREKFAKGHERQTIRAYAASHVYKYSDQSTISFTCNLKVCVRSTGDCDGVTPPICPSSSDSPSAKAKHKRDIDHPNIEQSNDPSIADLINITETTYDRHLAWPNLPAIFDQRPVGAMDFQNFDVSTGDIFILPKEALVERGDSSQLQSQAIATRDGQRQESASTGAQNTTEQSATSIIDASSTSSTKASVPNRMQQASKSRMIGPKSQLHPAPRKRPSEPTPPTFLPVPRVQPLDHPNHPTSPNPSTTITPRPTAKPPPQPALFDWDPFDQDDKHPAGTVCVPPLTYAIMAASTLLATVAVALFALIRLARTLGLLCVLRRNQLQPFDRSMLSSGHSSHPVSRHPSARSLDHIMGRFPMDHPIRQLKPAGGSGRPLPMMYSVYSMGPPPPPPFYTTTRSNDHRATPNGLQQHDQQRNVRYANLEGGKIRAGVSGSSGYKIYDPVEGYGQQVPPYGGEIYYS